MFENKEIKTEIIDFTDLDYEDYPCPDCKSIKKHRLNSYTRKIQDLGSIYTRKFLEFESITFECLDCGSTYLVEIDEALEGYHHSRRVIEVAMKLLVEDGKSAPEVAKHLNSYYNIEIYRGTLNQWFNKFKDEYIKHHKLVDPEKIENYSGFITIDGTFSHVENNSRKGRSKKPNKKRGLSLFLIPTGNGDYFCTLGRGRIQKK